MSPELIDSSSFSPDIREFIRLLDRHDVRYLIVGGEAVIFYGHARLTGDVDFYYDRQEGNARRLYAALHEFWEGSIPGVSGPAELIRNKEAAARPKDLDDVPFLKKARDLRHRKG